MSRIRIYLETKIIKDQKILLGADHIHYLKNVLRTKNGDIVRAFDNDSEWNCIFSLEGEVTIMPFEKLRSNSFVPDIWVCFSLVKKRNINYLVEKISEIGVKKIIPLITDYSEKKCFNLSRLRKISIEASEQSNSLKVPEILEVQSIENFLQNWDNKRMIFFCDESGGERIFDSRNIFKKYNKYAIFIGPIGGWSPNDRKLFKNLKIHNFTLGTNILKADTASIFALSCLRAVTK
tara:strand:- start:1138 stop:1842 length:705 start_codon:yes stop_codon:yes gene_type:complete